MAGVRISEETRQKIQKYATEKSISFAGYVRLACETQIDIEEGRAILIRDSVNPKIVANEELKELIVSIVDERLKELGVSYTPKSSSEERA